MVDTRSEPVATTLRSIAAYGLPTSLVLPAEPLTDDELEPVIAASGNERVLGILGESVRDDAFPVTDEQWTLLDERLAGQHAHGLKIERLLLDAVDALDTAAIESRVLKGVAIAHTLYPSPEWRIFADADLLVPSTSLLATVEVLAGAVGARRDVPELRPGFDERFGKEVLLRARGDLELDVHRTFVEGALGLTIDLDDLFAPGISFSLADRTLTMLPPAQQLLHAAYAGVLGEQPPRLMNLRDVAQLVLSDRAEPDDVVAMARRWGAEAVLARAVSTAWQELGLGDRPRLVEWAAAYVPTLARAAPAGLARGRAPSAHQASRCPARAARGP